MNKTKARPLPPRPDSAIYEVVDPNNNLSDNDSFDEVDDDYEKEDTAIESVLTEEEYLNASDVKRTLIIEVDDIPPPTPPRQNESQASTFIQGGAKLGPASATTFKYPPKTDAAPKLNPPARVPPQPPIINVAKLHSQPPIVPRSNPPPPLKPTPPVPAATPFKRELERFSSIDSYEYADEVPKKYLSDDEEYEEPDNTVRKLSAPTNQFIPSVTQETTQDSRKNSLPNLPQLPSQRPLPPRPPITETFSHTNGKINVPTPPVPNSRLKPIVPEEDEEISCTYEVERPDIKLNTENKKPESSIVGLTDLLKVKNSLNPVVKQMETIKKTEIPSPRNIEARVLSIKPPPLRSQDAERSNSVFSNRNTSRKVESQISDRVDKMLSYAWYFPEITREDADREITNLKKDGSFLVRKSKTGGEGCPYSITILCQNKIYNLNIRKRPDGLYALGKEKTKEQVFGSVAELISFHTNNPIDLLGPQSRNISSSIKLKEWPKKF